MTVEIAIMNKNGISLAADSAVTIGSGRMFYNNANKLFALSKYNPIGIMVYSNSQFMGYPVDIIVKEYRRQLKSGTFGTLREYWDDFISFMEKNFNNDNENVGYYNNIKLLLSDLDNMIKYEVKNKLNNTNKEMTNEEVQNTIEFVVREIVNSNYDYYSHLPDDESFKYLYNDIKVNVEPNIKILIENIIGTGLQEEIVEKIIEMCIMVLTKKHNNGIKTGIVIAGYGENELYPHLISGEFMGIYFNNIKYNITHDISVSNDENARVIAFAQGDVISTFMEGIDYQILEDILKTVDDYKIAISNSNCNVNNCLEELKKDIIKNVKMSSLENHSGPIMDTVAVAPKEELAQMTETLINLTSFRRKLSMDSYSQTVGGPIDVALISKGDGFIWIKRKYYFDRELNYGFYKNYLE